MKRGTQKKPSHTGIVSVIGPRAFPSDFDGTSGVEVYVEEVMRELLNGRCAAPVQLFVRRKYQQLVRSQAAVTSVGESGKKTRLRIRALPTLPGKYLEALSYSFLSSVLSACDRRVSLVWYHTVGMAVWAWLPKLCGKKVWVTVHSADWQRKKWSGFERVIFATVTYLSLHFSVQRFFFVSQRLMEMKFFPHHATKVLALSGVTRPVTHPTTHPKKRRVPSTDPYLLYIGRLVPEKRIEWLLQYATTHTCRVIIAGVHGNLPAYEEKLRTSYTSPSIEWRGAVHGQEKWQLLQSARLCVLPSELEGLPIIALEAAAVQTPFFVKRDLLPDDLAALSTVYTYDGNSYTTFSATLTKVLKEISSQKNTQSLADRRVLARYDWACTARVYRTALVQDGCSGTQGA